MGRAVANWHRHVPPWGGSAIGRSPIEPLIPITFLGSLPFTSAQADDTVLGVRGELHLLLRGGGVGSLGTARYISEVLHNSTETYFSFLQQTPFPSSHQYSFCFFTKTYLRFFLWV